MNLWAFGSGKVKTEEKARESVMELRTELVESAERELTTLMTRDMLSKDRGNDHLNAVHHWLLRPSGPP